MEHFITEPARTLAVKGDFDVIVCGGGPAGCGAAAAAALAGARTLLLERNQALGGIWSAGLMPWIIDCVRKKGLMEKWKEALLARGGHLHCGRTLGVPPETLKFFLEEELVKAGVFLRYGTQITAAVTDNGLLTHVVTESKSGREAWRGKVFIDCTGDGDLAAFAGCAFDYGNAAGEIQPASLNAIVAGIKYADVEKFFVPSGKIPLKEELARCGIVPSYAMPSLFPFGEDVFGWMTHHAYNVCAFDADALTRATLEGRSELQRQIAGLRSLGGIWKDLHLVVTAERLGCREARRIRGRASVEAETFGSQPVAGKSSCASTVLPDIHAPDPRKSKGVLPQERELVPRLPIPFLAQCAESVENLLLAGRCISGDFASHASYRMTGTAVTLGEVAGLAAAWSVKNAQRPWQWQDVPYLNREDQ